MRRNNAAAFKSEKSICDQKWGNPFANLPEGFKLLLKLRITKASRATVVKVEERRVSLHSLIGGTEKRHEVVSCGYCQD